VLWLTSQGNTLSMFLSAQVFGGSKQTFSMCFVFALSWYNSSVN